MKITVSWKGGQPDSEVELADDGSDLLSALARAHEAAMTKKKATATTASKKKKGTTAGSRKSLPTKRQEAESANSSRTFPEPAADVEEAHGPLLGGAMHRQPLSRLLPTAVAVGIKGDIYDSRTAVAQLPELVCIKMAPQRASDVAKTGLPQYGIIDQTLD